MQTVAETPTFSRQADKLFSDKERRELIECLAENPLPVTRFPGRAESDKTDLTPQERRAVAALVEAIKSQGRETK